MSVAALLGSLTYQDSLTYGALGGAMPPTPLPDWATTGDDPDPPGRQDVGNR